MELLRRVVLLVLVLTMGVVIVREVKRDRKDPCCDRAVKVVSLIKSGDDDSLRPYLDSAMISSFSKVPSSHLWRQISGRYGECLSIGSPKQSMEGRTVVVLVPCQFEYADVDLKVYFDYAQRVCGFFYFKWRENGKSIPPDKRASIETKRANEAITALAKQDTRAFSGLLDTDMARFFDSQAQQSLWQNIESKYGRFQGVTKSAQIVKNDADSVSSVCRFTGGSATFRIEFNIGGQISGLFVK
jgi:hypothetical protein